MQAKYAHNIYFLVRHGEAETTVRNIVSSEKNGSRYHLTERGKRQLEETAHALEQEHPDFIVSSPVTRAKESAEILESVLGIPLTFDPRLGESGMGVFEDKPLNQFLEYVRSHGGRLKGLSDEGIEGYIDIRERVRSFLEDVSENFAHKKIIIVSHGDPIQEMYGELMDIGSEQAEAKGSWYPEKGSCMLVAQDKIKTYVPKS